MPHLASPAFSNKGIPGMVKIHVINSNKIKNTFLLPDILVMSNHTAVGERTARYCQPLNTLDEEM